MANLSVAPLLCPGLLLEAAHSEYDSNYKALPASFPCAHDSKEIILYSYCEARPWTHLYIYICIGLTLYILRPEARPGLQIVYIINGLSYLWTCLEP